MKIYKDIYPLIISAENLFAAWEIFKRDKRNKPDVMEIEQNIEREIFKLHRELREKIYRHGPYSGFWIRDPKLRRINKAVVRDRILHHAIFKILNPIFEPTFIPNSYSCRVGKGTHKGVEDLEKMIRAESRNYTKECWALKCDIRKFFDSIDHDVLLQMLETKIRDEDAMWLLREIVESFTVSRPNLFERRGVPIGNLTSQIFANIYMNELDQFMKQELRVKNYARYTDDFVIVSTDRKYLEWLLKPVSKFLADKLGLEMHPRKVILRRASQGVDFLGYVIFPHHTLMRASTKKRMLRKTAERVAAYESSAINEDSLKATLRSYLGVMSHADAHELTEQYRNQFWI
ncbi:MAG TPA: reverse transcriptase domain-containing protein [Candidatus Paceibacterota bacterium]